MNIILIAAISRNFCIGNRGDIPWHIPADFRRFKILTSGKPCIMGRKTFESIYEAIGSPLPGRDNIVVSRAGYDFDKDMRDFFKEETASKTSVTGKTSLNEALAFAEEKAKKGGLDRIYVIGGGEIYTQSLPMATHLELTFVDMDVAGDAFFPKYDDKDWKECFREDHPDEEPGFSFVTLERKRA